MLSTNKLMLDLRDQDELAEYLLTKGPGDTCVFDVTVQIDEKTSDQATFSVKHVEVDEDEQEDLAEQGESADEGVGEGNAGLPGAGGESGGEGQLDASSLPKAPAAAVALFGKKRKSGG